MCSMVLRSMLFSLILTPSEGPHLCLMLQLLFNANDLWSVILIHISYKVSSPNILATYWALPLDCTTGAPTSACPFILFPLKSTSPVVVAVTQLSTKSYIFCPWNLLWISLLLSVLVSSRPYHFSLTYGKYLIITHLVSSDSFSKNVSDWILNTDFITLPSCLKCFNNFP